MFQIEPMQLDFFRTEEECEMIQMREMIEKIRISQDKCRRKQFADIGSLKTEHQNFSERLSIIERYICRET